MIYQPGRNDMAGKAVVPLRLNNRQEISVDEGQHDEDEAGTEGVVDTRVRQTFLRANYDVDSGVDRRAFADDMTWVRGHKKYTTMRGQRKVTVAIWVVATVGTVLIGQYIPAIPFSQMLQLLGK